MKFYLAYDKTSDQFNDIKLWIRKHMDGSVSSKMRESGVTYDINYGVSSVHLRKYALQITPSSRLAWRLWDSRIRECMLLALMLFEKDLTVQELDLLGNDIVNIELAEQFGFSLGGNIPLVEEKLLHWLKSDNEYKQVAALISVATLLQRNGLDENNGLKQFSTEATSLEFYSFSMQRAMVRLLTQIVKIEDYKSQIKLLVDGWMAGENAIQKAVANEILIELEYS